MQILSLPHIFIIEAILEEKCVWIMKRRGLALANLVKKLGMKGDVPALLIY